MTDAEFAKHGQEFMGDPECCPFCSAPLTEQGLIADESNSRLVAIDYFCGSCSATWSATFAMVEVSYYDEETDEVLDYNPNNQIWKD